MVNTIGVFGTLGLVSGVSLTGAVLSKILDTLDKNNASLFVSGLTKVIVYGIVFYILSDLCISILNDYYLMPYMSWRWWK